MKSTASNAAPPRSTRHKYGVQIEWQGQGLDEVGRDSNSGDIRVRIDKRYFRPTEVDRLLGDPAKAKEVLGWEAKTEIDVLVKEMVEADLLEARRDHLCETSGFRTLNHFE